MTMILAGPRSVWEFFTGTNIGLAILVVLLCLAWAITASILPPAEEKITLTKTQLDEIKADAYTAGHIDGRGSVFFGDEGEPYCHLGVPEGYEPSPYPEWRKYATVISNTSNSWCEK
jgi:hypothetical protein